MFKRIFVFFCLFAYASLGQAVFDFYLINEAGDKLGPFAFKDGQVITVAKGKYTVQVADTSAVAKKLRDIKLPRAEFVNATLEQVVRFVKAKTRELDPEGKGIDINFRDKPKAEQVEGNSDSPKSDSDDWGLSKTTSSKPSMRKYIDLDMTNISIAECLTHICEQTDTSWSVENGRVIIER